jgi:U3 small nucleolar RNA-associated protein 13
MDLNDHHRIAYVLSLSFISPHITLSLIFSFKKARTIAPLYTGGPVAITRNGLGLITCIEEQALLTDLESGAEICRFAGVRTGLLALNLTDTVTGHRVYYSTLYNAIGEASHDLYSLHGASYIRVTHFRHTNPEADVANPCCLSRA